MWTYERVGPSHVRQASKTFVARVGVQSWQRGGVAEKEPERVPVEPETPDVAVPAKQHSSGWSQDMSGLRKLAAAVLVRAFEGCENRQPGSWMVRSNSQPMLELWCQITGPMPGKFGRKRGRTAKWWQRSYKVLSTLLTWALRLRSWSLNSSRTTRDQNTAPRTIRTIHRHGRFAGEAVHSRTPHLGQKRLSFGI